MLNKITSPVRKLANFANPSSIDSFKSLVDRRGGLTNPNRFAIVLRPPERSLFNLDIRDIAVRVISNSFSIQSLFNDPRDMTIMCDSVSLPGRVMNSIERSLGSIPTEKLVTNSTSESLAITFISTNDFYIRKLFDQWQNSIIDRRTRTVAYENEYKVPMTIMQLNSKNIPVYSVRLSGVFPSSVSAITLSNESALGSTKIEVTLSYDDFEVIGVEGAVKDIIPFEDLSPANVLRDLRGSLPF
jgi:hypothetical protein